MRLYLLHSNDSQSANYVEPIHYVSPRLSHAFAPADLRAHTHTQKTSNPLQCGNALRRRNVENLYRRHALTTKTLPKLIVSPFFPLPQFFRPRNHNRHQKTITPPPPTVLASPSRRRLFTTALIHNILLAQDPLLPSLSLPNSTNTRSINSSTSLDTIR